MDCSRDVERDESAEDEGAGVERVEEPDSREVRRSARERSRIEEEEESVIVCARLGIDRVTADCSDGV